MKAFRVFRQEVAHMHTPPCACPDPRFCGGKPESQGSIGRRAQGRRIRRPRLLIYLSILMSGLTSACWLGSSDRDRFDADIALLDAVVQGDVSAAAHFIDVRGARVNARDSSRKTPLHWAVASPNASGSMVELLIDRGANVSAKDEYGMTPLHCAMFLETTEAVAALLRNGADVNAKANQGVTALHFAAAADNAPMIRFLVERGADVNARDQNGSSALDWARDRNSMDAVKVLTSP